MRRRRVRFLAVAALWLCAGAASLPAADTRDWRSVAVVRFGNIDAIDSEDGPLAGFLKSIRNDGMFSPPMRTLAGPAIRNPTFYGLVFEAWMELALLAPSRPGALAEVWIFPVDNRDEYTNQLANQGLSEYEGMDGVSVLREMDADGNFRSWYLEWLPGEIGFFGGDRSAVAAARQMYAENSAARGLLTGRARSYIEPDIAISLDLSKLAAWQDREPGQYWWRDRVAKLARDLVDFWAPTPARTRLIQALADELALWPQRLEPINVDIWFEDDGVEWVLDVAGDGRSQPASSLLESMRRLPEQAALAFAAPITPASFRGLGEWAGRLLLGGAGGVVTAEARSDALVIFNAVARSLPRQMASAWVLPPPGTPELGGARLLVGEWENPDNLETAWELVRESCRSGTPISHALAQLGWEVVISEHADIEGTAGVDIRSVNGAAGTGAIYYNAGVSVRRNGAWVAVAVGPEHIDSAANRRIQTYRAGLAHDAVMAAGDGTAAVRSAFTRMGPRGASFLAILDPVKLAQMALVEVADWRPRAPDQHEPSSTQFAREMLEYGSGGAWTAAGELDGRVWRCNGGIGWRSLSRLAGALGITESIGME